MVVRTDKAFEHTFCQTDDADASQKRQVWLAIEPCIYGVLLSVYKNRPSEEEYQIPLASVILELFNNRINARLWNEHDLREGDDPHVLPLCRNVDTWIQGE